MLAWVPPSRGKKSPVITRDMLIVEGRPHLPILNLLPFKASTSRNCTLSHILQFQQVFLPLWIWVWVWGWVKFLTHRPDSTLKRVRQWQALSAFQESVTQFVFGLLTNLHYSDLLSVLLKIVKSQLLPRIKNQFLRRPWGSSTAWPTIPPTPIIRNDLRIVADRARIGNGCQM